MEKHQQKVLKLFLILHLQVQAKQDLNGYGVKQFANNNIIVINNDELKPFHPKADEISKLYPEYYIKVTNEASKVWTDALMDRALEKGYNVMYEGTGRKIKIFEKIDIKRRNMDMKQL